MDTFQHDLNRLRDQLLYRDDEYWDVSSVLARTPEIIMTQSQNGSTLQFVTFDGFVIRAVFMDMRPMYSSWWNGYVTVPDHFEADIFARMSDYSVLEIVLPYVPVEFTFGSTQERRVGWDHGHYYDQSLSDPMDMGSDKIITGPVQILEEGLAVVRSFRDHEYGAKRAQMFGWIEEELVQKMWAPARVERWLEHDVF